jgi:hypothetical protein
MALQVLRKNLPLGKHSMIISTIVNEIVESKSTRRCYYVENIYMGPLFKNAWIIRREDYKNTKSNKYEIVGDFEVEDLTYVGTFTQITGVLSFFDSIKIDTICINCEKIQILYDATGHINIGQKWLGIYKYWVNIKKQAEIEGHPDNLIIKLD